MQSDVEIPSPLSVPAEAFARACAAAGMKGRSVGAIARYRGMFRSGSAAESGVPVELPRIGRLTESGSAGGGVRKFTLPLGGARAGVDDRGDKNVTLETE